MEFAIILPFLILFMIGLMYFGFMFSNYVALNDIAREAARSAAMLSAADYETNGAGDRYSSIRQSYVQRFNDDSSKSASTSLDEYYLPNTLYRWDPSNKEKFDIEYRPNRQVQVKLVADLDRSNGSLADTFFNIIGDSTLGELTVVYSMYSEIEHTADTED